MRILGAAAFVTAALCGCAVYRQPAANVAQRASIETDMPGGNVISGFSFVRMDDQRAAPFGKGGPSQMYVSPGAHVFRVLWQAPLALSGAQFRMVALPGHQYVVKHEVAGARVKFWIVDKLGSRVDAVVESF